MSDPQFVVVCEDCEMGRRTDDLGEAIAFSVNHHRHTGHHLSWEKCTLINEVIEIPERTRWRVRCNACDTERLFEQREDAEAFYADHEVYAGHQADELEAVTLPRLSDIGVEDVQKVLDYCFEHAESTQTVPTDAVITAFEDAGLTQREAAAELAVAEREHESIHLGDGLLTR